MTKWNNNDTVVDSGCVCLLIIFELIEHYRYIINCYYEIEVTIN